MDTIRRNKASRPGSLAITFGAALVVCALVTTSLDANAAEAKPTKSAQSKSKKKFDKGLIDNTVRDRKTPPIQFDNWPEPEAAAPVIPPSVVEQPAPTPSQQLRELE